MTGSIGWRLGWGCLAGWLLSTAAATNSWGQMAEATPPPAEFRAGFEDITPEQAREWLHRLAGPEFEGRGTGQTGYIKAAHWVAGQVAEFGLQPKGDAGTYFQMLPMSRLAVDGANSELTLGDFRLPVLGNLSFSCFADQNEVGGKLVFLSLTGASPQLPEGVDLREKIVIYVADEAAQRTAPRLIASQGPAASLRVAEIVGESSVQVLQEGGRTRSTSVSGVISATAADELAQRAGVPNNWRTGPADQPAITSTQVANLRLRIRQEGVAVPNVVAWLEGSDPAVNDEYIVIGAHLDHLGVDGDTVYPGADDNGSGSTAILSIAKALSLPQQRPRRSVLFMWFAAEERGLIGSRHYCDNPQLPLEKMVCMLNIDMVGRNEEKPGETAEENAKSIHLVGSQKGDPRLHEVILRANQHVGFEFEFDEEGVFGRSDQASFYNKGASVAFLFGGFHPDYHQPGDLPSKINYDKIVAAARLYFLTIQFASENGPFVRPATPADQ